MSNEKFQKALSLQSQKTPPIWFMRQAGRYHSHYQNLREKYGFMELCKQPELSSEVALGPIQDFDFDVSIMFSDLLFPLEALGMGLDYNPGPTLSWQLDANSLSQLKEVSEAVAGLAFQKQVLQYTREALPKDKSLIGFIGGPWTLYTYAVEGGHKGALQKAKNNSSLFVAFCEKLVPLLIHNIQLQLEGGAEIVMVFDTAAGELGPDHYNKWVVPQLKKLTGQFHKKLGYYSKWTQPAHLQPQVFKDLNWVGFGVDHRWNLSELLQHELAGFIQGNFDQSLLFADTADFDQFVYDYIAPFKELSEEERAGWVCGLGHGVLPKTPEANVRRFIEIIRKEFS